MAGSVEAVSMRFEWEINNFLCYKQKVGEFLESPTFTLNCISDYTYCYFLLYPRGRTESCKDYISISICSNEEFKATWTFIIHDNEGKIVMRRTTEEHTDWKGGWGFFTFISREFVTNPANGIIIKDGKLTITCQVNVKTINGVERKSITNQELDEFVLPRLADKYEALLNDTKFSDICLISEGNKVIKAHKCILAKSSSVFAAMFENEMREKRDNVVKIDGIKCDVLLEMLRFVYSEKVNNIDTLASELVVAADMYALDELKDKCERAIARNLCRDNVIECLQLADSLRMDMLKTEAIEFIVENARDVSERPEFDLLSRDIVRKVFRRMASRI